MKKKKKTIAFLYMRFLLSGFFSLFWIVYSFAKHSKLFFFSIQVEIVSEKQRDPFRMISFYSQE